MSAKPGAGDVGARDLGACRVGFERDEPAVGGKAAREPDRAVAAERADLQDAARADRLREQHQQLALVGRDIDPRQPGVLGSPSTPLRGRHRQATKQSSI